MTSMTSKRFLNVVYENIPTEIDTNNMDRFIQVQEKIGKITARNYFITFLAPFKPGHLDI